MLGPLVIGGEAWGVAEVEPGDPRLVDRTGEARLAVTDPATRTVSVLRGLEPPLLDRVLLHEAAHAATVSHGLLGALRSFLPSSLWVPTEEWAAALVEAHGIEAAEAASKSLGRPVCVRGFCHD